MIYGKIHGRLGNQMFQYAAIRAFSKKINDPEIILDLKDLGNPSFQNELQFFNINTAYFKSKKIELTTKQKILIKWIRFRRKLSKLASFGDFSKESNNVNKFEIKNANCHMKNGLYFIRRGYVKLQNTQKVKTKIFDGYFESPKYFNEIKQELQEEFSPIQKELEKNIKTYKEIEASNSVCVSIRRGDFTSRKNSKTHYICTPEYFIKAIDLMWEKIKSPRFFVFSDDIDWVKANIHFPDDTIYEDGSDPVWEKLRLMYSCKHFIISNSTFSWWAQYLSRNKEKIVIAPSIWKRGYGMPDIYEKEWSLINIEELEQNEKNNE